jgi:hypothetical protein
MLKGRYDFVHVLLEKTADQIQKDFIDNPHGKQYFMSLSESQRSVIMGKIKTTSDDLRKHSQFLKELESFMDLDITIKQLMERI